jgi:hypothetical protein
MKFAVGLACVALALAQDAGSSPMTAEASPNEKTAAFSLADVKYFHRYTKGDLHEYTPKGQDDLNRWTDMVTINVYRNATDGEALASAANTVLQTYKANKAMVVKTSSVPRTHEKPAEHLIVVLFPRREFIEAVFARFRMHDGIGSSVVYSHRIYGAKSGDAMSAWLKKNGPTIESKLMAWSAMPKQAPGK